MTPKQKKQKTLEWYHKHREFQIQKNREWKIKNRERMLAQKKEYHFKNRDKILKRKKRYRESHQDEIKAYRRRPDVKKKQRERVQHKRDITNHAYDRQHYQKNRIRILAYGKKHAQIPEIKARRNETARIRRKDNPQSNRRGSIDLQLAMNNVRRRDKNTCQWQGCNLTHRQVSIHVHHIFPRNEHPEFELIEQYMICYCANHHGLWHRYNGDSYSEMIPARYQENGFVDEILSVRGRD